MQRRDTFPTSIWTIFPFGLRTTLLSDVSDLIYLLLYSTIYLPLHDLLATLKLKFILSKWDGLRPLLIVGNYITSPFPISNVCFIGSILTTLEGKPYLSTIASCKMNLWLFCGRQLYSWIHAQDAVQKIIYHWVNMDAGWSSWFQWVFEQLNIISSINPDFGAPLTALINILYISWHFWIIVTIILYNSSALIEFAGNW